jgi:hypothetical protein
VIKRKNGLWLICYEGSGAYIEGSGYFKSSTEAYAAEASVLKAHPEPVQTLNVSSVPKATSTRKK